MLEAVARSDEAEDGDQGSFTGLEGVGDVAVVDAFHGSIATTNQCFIGGIYLET